MEGTARKWFYPVCRRFLADAFHLHGVGLPVDDDGQVTGTGGAAHLGGDAVVVTVMDGAAAAGAAAGAVFTCTGASSFGSGFL